MEDNYSRRAIAVFASLGGGAALIPSMIPKTQVELTIPGFELLVAIPVMFWGLFMGVLFAPSAASRIGSNVVARVSGLAAASGLLLAGFAGSSALFLTGAAAFGLGFGFLEVTITAATKQRNQDSAQELTKLNAAFATAAVMTPLALVAELAILGSNLIAGIVAAMALVSSWSLGITEEKPSGSAPKVSPGLPSALLIAAFLYVGAESLLAGWGPTLVSSFELLSVETAPLGSTLFWGLLALGRLVSIRVTPRHLSTAFSLTLWPLVAAAGLAAAAIFQTPAALWLGYSLAAFATGPIYGLLIGQALKTVESGQVSKATRNIILIGAAGGFALPGLVQVFPSQTLAIAAAATAMVLVSTASAVSKQPELQGVSA